MTWLTVQPDKEFSIVEEHLRFTVPSELPRGQVPTYIGRDLVKSIEILEKLRGWRLIDRIPSRLKFCGEACCSKIRFGLPGQELPIRFEPSKLQGDTDDAHNFDEMSDPYKRNVEEGKADWVAIVHFWQPMIVVSKFAKQESMRLGESAGFVSPENMPDMSPSGKHRWINDKELQKKTVS